MTESAWLSLPLNKVNKKPLNWRKDPHTYGKKRLFTNGDIWMYVRKKQTWTAWLELECEWGSCGENNLHEDDPAPASIWCSFLYSCENWNEVINLLPDGWTVQWCLLTFLFIWIFFSWFVENALILLCLESPLTCHKGLSVLYRYWTFECFFPLVLWGKAPLF